MTSYGGYSRTSYGAQGGEDGGGFLGGSQQGSQGGQGGGKSFNDDSLRPVTIKQLLDIEEAYPGADFTIDDMPITQVTLVGQVRAVNPQPTNVTYRLDDGTGLIDVKKWVDADKPDDGPGGAGTPFPLDSWVRIWGRLKSFNQKRHVGAHMLRAVDDYNEVTYHMLETTYVHLSLTRGAPGGGGGAATNGHHANGDGGGDSMFVDQYGGGAVVGGEGAWRSKVVNCSAAAQKVFKYLHETPGGNEGLHLNMIASGAGMGARDVLGAADELLSHGVIYTTVDDETWAVLDY